MQTYFQKSLADKGLIPNGIDPRHVEGYIRVAHSTVTTVSQGSIHA